MKNLTMWGIIPVFALALVGCSDDKKPAPAKAAAAGGQEHQTTPQPTTPPTAVAYKSTAKDATRTLLLPATMTRPVQKVLDLSDFKFGTYHFNLVTVKTGKTEVVKVKGPNGKVTETTRDIETKVLEIANEPRRLNFSPSNTTYYLADPAKVALRLDVNDEDRTLSYKGKVVGSFYYIRYNLVVNALATGKLADVWHYPQSSGVVDAPWNADSLRLLSKEEADFHARVASLEERQAQWHEQEFTNYSKAIAERLQKLEGKHGSVAEQVTKLQKSLKDAATTEQLKELFEQVNELQETVDGLVQENNN